MFNEQRTNVYAQLARRRRSVRDAEFVRSFKSLSSFLRDPFGITCVKRDDCELDSTSPKPNPSAREPPRHIATSTPR
ncbi:hypothetical protein EYR36_011939 [Pleurotus pulmonarius]|nr:hypothetical protein EYR36_011936 [Pleurotus pulmonarius]KAF4566508.1 hypothetical protein EYR36_011939 [Pleurotus pulmonarius]